eukprot:SAG11_NODE_6329_length_1335_cov_1.639159_1_plen_154_part_01
MVFQPSPGGTSAVVLESHDSPEEAESADEPLTPNEAEPERARAAILGTSEKKDNEPNAATVPGIRWKAAARASVAAVQPQPPSGLTPRQIHEKRAAGSTALADARASSDFVLADFASSIRNIRAEDHVEVGVDGRSISCRSTTESQTSSARSQS